MCQGILSDIVINIGIKNLLSHMLLIKTLWKMKEGRAKFREERLPGQAEESLVF